MKEFNDKVVVITGAAGGIGKALTGRFLEEGARVCAVDLSEEKLEDLNSEFDSHKNLFTAVTDISKEDSTSALFDHVNQKWSQAMSSSIMQDGSPLQNLKILSIQNGVKS